MLRKCRYYGNNSKDGDVYEMGCKNVVVEEAAHAMPRWGWPAVRGAKQFTYGL